MRREAGVDVWLVDLRAVPSCGARPWGCLSDDERRRVQRIGEGSFRRRTVATREALRHIVGERRHIAPSAVVFRYGPCGKPELALGGEPLHFNVSHSDDMALIAMSSDGPVGVDIERIRGEIEVLRTAERFFSSTEARGLARLPPSLRRRAFFTCWSRKEALVKATGEGLRSLKAFEVSTAPGEPARVIAARGDPQGAAVWTLHDVSLGPRMVGAVAARGRRGIRLSPLPVARLPLSGVTTLGMQGRERSGLRSQGPERSNRVRRCSA